MSWGIIVLLIVIGIIAIVLEFLVIPGGIVGIFGGLLVASGVGLSYYFYGATAGNITLIISFALTITALILMLRSRTWRKLMLNTTIDGKMNQIDSSKITVGMEGIAVSRLAPSGKGKFNDEIVEVFSNHEFIDVNSQIIITKIEGNKIFVKLN